VNRRTLSDKERADWLQLYRTENIGPIIFRQLVRRFGTARAVLDALPAMAERGGKKDFRMLPPNYADSEIARGEKIDARIIGWCEPDYPEALAAIEDAPPVITVRGPLNLINKRCIGVVGTRNASVNGCKMAGTLARELGEHNIVVASSLALGIDTAAHEASLATGTVAVVAGGVDIVYPQENKDLYNRIAAQGCILSDMPLGIEPFSKLCPRRNRLISGLSLGIVVVEAAMKSGSLITARMALDQGREVFAVPGSPLDPRCTGANDLIRQGAVLTERAADILGHIHSMPKMLAEPPANDFDAPAAIADEKDLEAARGKIFESLDLSPVSVDDLVRQCHVSAAIVLTVLLELELAGRVERQTGHKIVRVG
jgi:DNA processing protein